MPPPNRRHEPSPEELARQIADQLARSKPTPARFSFRNSVSVGRLIAGAAALVSIALVVAGVVVGVSWLLGRTTEPQPEVLANTEQNDVSSQAVGDDSTTTRTDGALLPLVPLVFPTPLSDTTDSVDQTGPTAVTIPPATTTTTSPTPTTSNPVVSTSMPTTTTQPTTTTTLPAMTTTAPATTTTSPPATTTTEPTTTTTTATSTTTEATTTTTTTTATSTTTEATTTTTTRPSPPSTPGRGG